MREFNIWELSLFQIRLFLVTAEYENMTKAANHLHVTQSMLSKNIKAIETSLGLILFIRKKEGMILTPAGRFLYNELSGICKNIENGIIKAHSIQKNENYAPIIAYPDTINLNLLLKACSNSYSTKYGDIKYFIEPAPFHEISAKLLHNEIDIAFSCLFDMETYYDENINIRILERFPLQVFMTPENPLCSASQITPQMLKNQKIIILSETNTPNYKKNVIYPLSVKGEFTPNIPYYASTAKAVSININQNDEVFIADKYYFKNYFGQNLVCRDISGSESGIILAWRRNKHYLIDQLANYISYFWNNFQSIPTRN